MKKISAADGSKTIQGAKFKIHNDSLNQWYTIYKYFIFIIFSI